VTKIENAMTVPLMKIVKLSGYALFRVCSMRLGEEDLGGKVVIQIGCFRDDGRVMANVYDLELVVTESCCWLCVVDTDQKQRLRQRKKQENH